MNKYKILLMSILLFISGCSTIQDKPAKPIIETNDSNIIVNDEEIKEISKNDTIEMTQNEKQELTIKSDDEIEKVKESKEENKIQDDQTANTKDNSSSIGKGNSSTEKDEVKKPDETPVVNEENKQVENKNEESSKETGIEDEVVKVCVNHNWDDSHGNKPQFNELIFDDWEECDCVMNDIYNNFVTEEKPEYNKYYQNSKGQWMSSIIASDVWCECGAHAYAIFITYE